MKNFAIQNVAVAVGLSALMAGCGGGNSGAAGTTTPLSKTTGTITGLGSVYIDGVAYDDSQVQVQELGDDGLLHNSSSDLGIGQQVSLSHNGVGNKPRITQIALESAVKGTVSSVTASGFTVLQQQVKVNSDSSIGPVTYFAGLATTIADIAANDRVIVYGQRDATGAIVATRVQEVSAQVVERVKLTGVVNQVSTGFIIVSNMRVNYSANMLKPLGVSLVPGDVVKVLGVQATAAINAVRVVHINKQLASGLLTLNGLVTSYTPGQSIGIGEQTIAINGSTKIERAAFIAVGKYAKVVAVVDANGVATASKVEGKLAGVDSVTLVGDIANYNALSNSFTVRGITVSNSLNLVPTGSCAMADGSTVSVVGSINTTTGNVTPVLIACVASTGKLFTPFVHREYKGVVGSVNTADKTLTLTTVARGTITIAWDTLTRFKDGARATNLAAGQALEVDAYVLADGKLLAKKIAANLRDRGSHSGNDDDSSFDDGSDDSDGSSDDSSDDSPDDNSNSSNDD